MASTVLLYVGTYTDSGSEGIYLYELETSTGALKRRGVTKGIENPSFLAFGPGGRTLYAANENDEGTVTAFTVEEDGSLNRLNQQPSGGASPCYVSVDRSGKVLLAANYSSGSLGVLPLSDDGRLNEPAQVIEHQGSSVHPERQGEPHAHCVVLSPDGWLALAADLGIDRLMVYALDPNGPKLTPHETPWVELQPGAGPRHLVFHPSGHVLYSINELDSTVTLFAYDAEAGNLQEEQRVPTLPEGFSGENTTAEIRVSPSGKFLYASNRGHDSLAIFSVDPASGRLTLVGHEPTQGKTPRNFALEPSGRVLVAANQGSDSLVSFFVDEASGKLTPTGHRAEVSKPVYLLMRP